MSSEPLNGAIIIGSNREGRQGRDDTGPDLIALAEIDLPADVPHCPGSSVLSLADRLSRSDGTVMVTPEYNHGYPASVKQAIDLSGESWAAEPAGFASNVGLSGGVRAVEPLWNARSVPVLEYQ